MESRSSPVTLIAMTLAMLACDGGDDMMGPSRAQLELAASRTAIAMVAVAAGGEGSAFLDNFLPCTRRGVISYYNTEQGRMASFSGCDLGAGVTIDGAGELRWAGPDLPTSERGLFCDVSPTPSCETALAWSGTLSVTLAGGSQFRLDGLRIDDLMMEPDQGLYPEGLDLEIAGLGLAGLDVTAGDETFRVEDSALPGEVFGSAGIDIDAIPNPSGSLDALTSDDLERLAYDPALAMFAFLIDEVSDVRPDHTHTLECGTSVVTFDQDQLPLIQNDWSSCETLGAFLSGTFSIQFGPDTDFNNGPFTMVVEGNLTLGGGIPKIELVRLEWSAAYSLASGALQITGELETSSGEIRTFDLQAIADD